jgi:hypothetical protein
MRRAAFRSLRISRTYRPVPRLHLHFPAAVHFLALLNDYRTAHGKAELAISHQFCRACQKQAERLQSMRGFTRKVKKCFPRATISSNSIVVPFSSEPLPEILIVWPSEPQGKEKLFMDAKYAGFALSASVGEDGAAPEEGHQQAE